MKRIGILAALAALTACTAEPMSENPEAQFHMPFTYKDWVAKREQGVCSVTTGYRGLIVKTSADGVSVASVRDLIPGEQLTLTVNQHRYITTDTAFDAADARAIVEDFLVADKAYLRVRERGNSYHGNNQSDNILKLEGFAKAYHECAVSRKNSKAKK